MARVLCETWDQHIQQLWVPVVHKLLKSLSFTQILQRQTDSRDNDQSVLLQPQKVLHSQRTFRCLLEKYEDNKGELNRTLLTHELLIVKKPFEISQEGIGFHYIITGRYQL